ncbi:MAG: PLP-dependent lyase/thiolase [Candidatus Diapherotrites archaeon]|uniref:PLP-dependent lyase/thiolase n=1 Tax=Candidatus Iainarchaeum sp. TaxID=3101447 RepID=A0A8T3YME4_9ARCH|nr:PLP-dependent lyase/thiolase [Candidatus Diapherotrites archaeon]
MKPHEAKATNAKSILESGKKPLGWKPEPGLVRIPGEREKLFRELSKIPGRTPLVEIQGIPGNNKLFAKMECANRPTGSHYDRIYPVLLHAIERIGVNPQGFTLVENSSGNATPAFGWFARKLGYETIAFLPAELTEARRRLTSEQCDKVVLANEDGHGWGVFGAANAMKEALQKNREERKARPEQKRLYCVNHSQVTESLGPMETMAREIEKQLRGKKPDFFLGVAGNGTILYGLGKALKKKFGKMKVIAVETTERPVLYQIKYPGKYEKEYGKEPASVEDMKGKGFFAPGTGALGIDFPHLRSAAGIIDRAMLISREETEKAAGELKAKGHEVGHTSAMSYAAARKLAKERKNAAILIIFYDNMDRY